MSLLELSMPGPVPDLGIQVFQQYFVRLAQHGHFHAREHTAKPFPTDHSRLKGTAAEERTKPKTLHS